MAQSLAKLHIHLVFSTKQRERVLSDQIRDALHRYISSVSGNNNCPVIIVNSVPDHVHILFELGRTMSVSSIAEEIKRTSSKWLKSQNDLYSAFRWQAGYAAFAISAKDVAGVVAYISMQQVHHMTQTFPEEYRQILIENDISFDERYLWD